jgi:hypothetical protein
MRCLVGLVRIDVPPKRRFQQDSHGVTSQKAAFFTFTAAETSNFTTYLIIYYLSIDGAGVEPNPLLLQPFIGLLHQPWMTDDDYCGVIIGINEWQGKSKYSEKTYPSAPLSIRDST